MQQINAITHSTNNIYPRSGIKIIEQFPFECRNHHHKYTQIEDNIVIPNMLWFIKVKYQIYRCKSYQIMPICLKET